MTKKESKPRQPVYRDNEPSPEKVKARAKAWEVQQLFETHAEHRRKFAKLARALPAAGAEQRRKFARNLLRAGAELAVFNERSNIGVEIDPHGPNNMLHVAMDGAPGGMQWYGPNFAEAMAVLEKVLEPGPNAEAMAVLEKVLEPYTDSGGGPKRADRDLDFAARVQREISAKLAEQDLEMEVGVPGAELAAIASTGEMAKVLGVKPETVKKARQRERAAAKKHLH